MAKAPSHGGNECEDGDVARAETYLPISGDELFAFLTDLERLMRLNPQLVITEWRQTADGVRWAGENESNGRAFALTTRATQDARQRRIILEHTSGLKRRTVLSVCAEGVGSRLIVSECYLRLSDPSDARVAEVDKSLVPWVAALRRHLLARRRWRRWAVLFPVWRWWQEKVLISLSPFGRRVVRLIVWLSFWEFLLFVMLLFAWRLAA